MKRYIEYLNHLVREPVDELTRAQRMLRFWVDLGRFGAKQLTKDRAFEMAASLTFRTIFSLVPVVVLSMLVFRAFIDEQQASEWVKNELTTVYEFLGFSTLVAEPISDESHSQGRTPAPDANPSVNDSDNQPGSAPPGKAADEPLPETPSDHAPASPQELSPVAAEPLPVPEKPEGLASVEPEEAEKLRVSLDEKIDELVQRAWQTNLGNVGAAGIVLFIWGALALLISVEDSFNVIYDCPGGRRWMSRITIYWAALTLGPVLIFTGIYLAGQIADWGAQARGLGWVLGIAMQMLSRVAGLVASWLLLLVVYLLIPNTHVRFRPALIGSLVAAILWEIAKWGFKLYVTTALPYSALYGSLALVPLFLYWLYITWLIVLFGLELTVTLQTMPGRTLEEQEKLRHSQRLMCDPQWFIPLMGHVAAAFRHGGVVGIDDLSHHLELPRLTVTSMANRLEQAGLLHKVLAKTNSRDGYTLARPPQDISLREILNIGRRVSKHDLDQLESPDWQFVQKLAAAQAEVAETATLADLAQQADEQDSRSRTT